MTTPFDLRVSRQKTQCVRFSLLLAAVLCGQMNFAHSADREKSLPPGFIQKTYTDADGDHRYTVFVPPQYSAERKWPIVLFLHGAGEKGTDGIKPIIAGLGTALSEHPQQDFIAVFPQCESVKKRHLTSWLADSVESDRALAILEQVEAEYAVDSKRRSLCGWSMGGYGTWSLAAANPQHWAGVLAVAGGQTENSLSLEQLASSRIPVWAVHGKQDELIRFEQSQALIQELNQLGGQGTLTLVEDMGHDVWRSLFADPRTLHWLANTASAIPKSLDDHAQPELLPSYSHFYIEQYTHLETLPDMLSLRLGNAALEVISEGIPTAIPLAALQGRLADIERTYSSGSETITVKLSNVEFECHVARVTLCAISGGRFLSRFEMQPLKLKIGSTSLDVGTTTASTGNFQIEIGRRDPVTLEIEMQPTVGEAGLELIALKQKFSIPDHNWYIAPPQAVQVDSQTYSKDNIITGVVGGLYLQKEEIEKTVLGVVPSLLKVVEGELKSRQAPKLARLLWPLPALVPDLSIAPSQVRTDQYGISLVFDMNVRSTTQLANNETPDTTAIPVPFNVLEMPHHQDLDFRISLSAIDKLGELIIREGFAYINLLDLPDSQLTDLTQPAQLHQIFPKMIAAESQHPVDVGLRLQRPFQIRSIMRDSAPGEVFIEFNVPNVGFEVLNPQTQKEARLSFSLKQELRIQTIEKDGIAESLAVTWLPHPVIKVLDEELPMAVNREAFETLFTSSWTRWSEQQSGVQRAIPQLQFGTSALVLKSFSIQAGVAALKFVPIQSSTSSSAALEHVESKP